MMRKNKKSLPEDIYRYSIFHFLAGKEILKNLSVSTTWQRLSNNLLSQTEKQQYYLVGKGIKVASEKMTLSPRELISIHEINDSFPKNGTVRLFLTEQEALDYSRFLRKKTNQNHIEQPAIFKVQLMGKISALQQENLTIQLFQPLIPLIAMPRRTPKHCRIHFLEADINKVIPILAFLKVDFRDNGSVKEYGFINFKKYPAQESKQSTSLSNKKCS